MNTRAVFFLAGKDVSFILKERATLIWLFIMPAIFFYFIGAMTANMAGTASQVEHIAVKLPAEPGFLADRLIKRLQDNKLEAVLFDHTGKRLTDGDTPFENYLRQLTIPPGFSANLAKGEAIELKFKAAKDGIGQDFDQVRIQKASYTLLADIIAATRMGSLDVQTFEQLDKITPVITLVVKPAGKRKVIPSGFEQSVPGIMVMFTLMVLLTSGAGSLFLERQQGALRRLAAAPVSRADIVAGKWLGRLALALIQISFAMIIGWLLFDMDWGPNLPMVFLVLLCWGGFCTSLAVLLANTGRTMAQVTGIGVLLSNMLAALGGAWWPIEITPQWMQSLQNLLPSGWTMDAIHQLVNFGASPGAAVLDVLLLAASSLLLGWLAVRKFKFE